MDVRDPGQPLVIRLERQTGRSFGFRHRPPPRRSAVLVATLLGIAFLLSGCGSSPSSADALRAYLHRTEPIRLGVNRLLEDADPVLDAYRAHHLTGDQAAVAMGALEQRFAQYTEQINALQPTDSTLANLHRPYAHTYILEDSYLNALVAALPSGDFSTLPNTQADQRAAIIEWRIQVEILAHRDGVHLPGDLQQAGRGEIAPSPGAGS
jgi:hypothetical protein